MANTIIQLKHSTVQGAVPVSLANGELSINTFDGKLYYADPTGTIQEFSGFEGPSGLNQEIQFNDSGVLGANANFTFNKSLPALNVGGVSLTNTYIQFGDGTRQYTANAGSGTASGVTIVLDTFTGTGACTTFGLSVTPTSENYTIVTINGVTQAKSTYSLSTSNIVFSEAPPNGSEIEVLSFSTPGTSGLLAYNEEYIGNGACTTFTLSNTPTSENYTIVSIDGVIQHKSTYSLSGSDIVFSEAPTNSSNIGVSYFIASTLLDSELTIYAANHANAAFIAANNATDTYVRNHANAAFDKANTVGDTATSAFIQANSAFNAANNATDTFVRAHANSAFDQANAAYSQANTNASNITIIQGVNVTQNTNISNIEGVNLTQNTSISNLESVNLTQNTNISNIEGVNLTQNTNTTNAQNKADSAFHQANGAFATANNEAGVNATQNTNITNAQNSASAAFIRANNSINANVGGVITGALTITANLNVLGNLTVSGNVKTIDTETLNITDPLIYLAANNYSTDLVDIGFVGNYYNGSSQRHAGLIRKFGSDDFYIFTNYDKEPETNIIDINDASFKKGTLYANLNTQLITYDGTNLKTYIDRSYNSANSAFHQANAAFTTANSAGKTIILFSDSPPAGPTNNTLWWQSNTGVLKVYYTDTDGSQWVDASPVAPTSSLLISNDTSSASAIYPIFTANTSGALSNVSVSSTKLTFTPSSGTLTATDFNSTSDLRRKENIQTIDNGLEIVQQINPVSFDWKETGKKGFGVIAQEIENLLPSIVGEDGEGYKSISYSQLISFLISAVKEQQNQIDDLKRKINGN